MKIGSLGEFETRIALRVMEAIAYGPLNHLKRELRTFTGHDARDFNDLLWQRLDGDPQEFEQMAECALKFALDSFDHKRWNQLADWTGVPIRRLKAIRRKLNGR